MKPYNPPIPQIRDWFPAAMEIMEAVYKASPRWVYAKFSGWTPNPSIGVKYV